MCQLLLGPGSLYGAGQGGRQIRSVLDGRRPLVVLEAALW